MCFIRWNEQPDTKWVLQQYTHTHAVKGNMIISSLWPDRHGCPSSFVLGTACDRRGGFTRPCSSDIWLLVVVSWSWSGLSCWLKDVLWLNKISSHAIVIPWLLSVDCAEYCVMRPNWKWLIGTQSMVSVITGWRELSKRLLHQQL